MRSRAAPVIDAALLVVRQHLIRVADALERVLRARLFVHVWMVFPGLLPAPMTRLPPQELDTLPHPLHEGIRRAAPGSPLRKDCTCMQACWEAVWLGAVKNADGCMHAWSQAMPAPVGLFDGLLVGVLVHAESCIEVCIRPNHKAGSPIMLLPPATQSAAQEALCWQ